MQILTVDDDKSITELTALLLHTYGFDVITSNTAHDAIRIVRERKPQAVLLDMMMPEMDGRQICRAIREFSAVPIIILSAINDPDTVAGALDSGADDYLVKPVPSDVLSAHLTRLIKRSGRPTLPEEARPASWAANTQPAKS